MTLQQGPGRDDAEAIALAALAFLAGDGERLGRFLALTGLGPTEIRAGTGDPAFLAGVLDHLMRDETLMMVFAAEAGLTPDRVASAFQLLAGDRRVDGW